MTLTSSTWHAGCAGSHVAIDAAGASTATIVAGFGAMRVVPAFMTLLAFFSFAALWPFLEEGRSDAGFLSNAKAPIGVGLARSDGTLGA